MKQMLKKLYFRLLPLFNRVPFYNRIRLGRGNTLDMAGARLQHCSIRCYGTGNTIRIAPRARLTACTVTVYGNENTVCIGEDVLMRNGSMVIEDDGNEIHIGARTRLTGTVHMACIEGKRICIGEDCLFSYEITLRTGDGHSVTDLQGNRINPSADIEIGDHVWVGHKATIGKGVSIAPHSVVATASVVTGSFTQPHCVLAGVPAKIIKQEIDWDFRRL